MSVTARDKKLIALIVPIAVVIGFWFLVLSPQRAELADLQEQRGQAEAARDAAVSKATGLQRSRNNYANDYAAVVRLGKAIPATLDMPSLLVQLETAAKGADIDFEKITAGPRTAASGTASGATGSEPPVAAGGEQAQSSPGKPVEKANNGVQQANGESSSSSSSSGATAATAPGLDSVPLDFTFNGSFFQLADFFHRIKRFVRVANDDIRVGGRLITIDGISFDSQSFPKLTAEVKATAYLSPKEEGATGGATAQGPTATPAGTTGTAPSAPAPSASKPSANPPSAPQVGNE